ncbi:Sof1-like domain containing protein [Brugia malayi]|uniref:DDB1- and CUL4-associated factor 13 n=2 Tax=Brugia TaxID=6278 RepID=A0A0K0JSK4_BRUMA|nr:Sof1-like domain containing protein [Brugia malayi]CDQ03703.1 Bm7473 [Brugia malayi]VIO93644.1 Sof1-like domain containing protein [Brugia malayi]
MRVKVLSRNPRDYQRETKNDIYKAPRNFNLPEDPFQVQVEYTRAVNAAKLNRVFAKPFISSLDGHNDGVSVLCKHPLRLSTILSGGRDGQIRIWNLPLHKCLATIQAHSGPVNGISCDNLSGETVITVGHDSQLKHWRCPDPVEGDLSEPIHSIPLNGVAHSVSHVVNSTDYVTCGEGIHVWNKLRDSPIRIYNLGVDSVYTVKCNPVEPEIIVGCGSDRTIVLLDTRQKCPLKKVTMKLRPNAISWNPMEAFTFTAANEDYNLYTFDIRKLTDPRRVYKGHTNAVMDVDYSPTGTEFVSGSYDRSLRIFPVESFSSREIYHTKRMQQVLSVLWSLDNKFVLSGSDEMNIRLWKANASEKLGPLHRRERATLNYNARLLEVYGEHPEVRRIVKRRFVPRSIYTATKEHKAINLSQRRKEENRRKHSKPGAVPYIPEHLKHMAKEFTAS